MKEEIIFLTGNPKKLLVAESYFSNSNYKIISKTLDVPEVQHKDCREVAKFSTKIMSDLLNKPVLKSDHAFMIEAYNGFPGAYMADIQRMLQPEGFYNLMRGIDNRNCKFVEALAYCEPDKDPIVVWAEKKGILTKELRGSQGMGIDYLFIPEGETKTLAEMTEKGREKMYDFKLWPKLLEKLEKKN